MIESSEKEIIFTLVDKDVALLEVGVSISEAILPILETNTSIGIFLEDGKPIGLITERDIIKNLIKENDKFKKAYSYAVKKLITLNANRSVEYALFLMSENDIKRLIVVDENGVFVGVLTQDIITSYLNKKLNSNKLRAINLVRGRELIKASIDSSLMDIANIFYKYKIGLMPIIDEDECMIGILTDTDMLTLAKDGVDFSLSVKEYMSSPVISVSEFATVEDILNIFEHYKIRHVVVASNSCQPVGVISKRDIIRNMNEGYYRMLEKKAKNFKMAIDTLTSPALEVFNDRDEFIIEWHNKKATEVFGDNLFDSHLDHLLDEKSFKQVKNELLNLPHEDIVFSFNELVFDVKVAKLNDNAISLIFNDITKYHNSKKFIHSLFDLLPQIITVSNGRKLAYCNNSMLEFFGYSSIESFLEKHSCICDLFIEEDGYLAAGEEGSWIYKSYQNTISDIETKVKMPIKSGDIRVFRLETKRFPDMEGLYVSSFFDITEAELYRHMISSQNQSLEDMVEERTAELKMSKALLEKAQSISKLANCIYDIENDDIFCYGDLHKILGVEHPPRSFDEFIGYFDKNSQNTLRTSIERVLEYKEDFAITLESKSSKSKKVFYVNAEPYEVEDGRVKKIFGTIQDISEQVELKRRAHYDSLTNIFNRNKIDEIIKSTLESVGDREENISVILFDIDYFKDINDRFGHQEGDRVLSDLALFVKKKIRSSDIFARWGGEEFMIVALGQDLLQAKALALKLREAIEEAKICTKRSLTCSFGVAMVEDGESFDSVTKRADKALYDAKGSGRNRVCVSKDI